MRHAYMGLDINPEHWDYPYVAWTLHEKDDQPLGAHGFHACALPLDTWTCNPPGQSTYHRVILDGDIDDRVPSRLVASKIMIGDPLSDRDMAIEHISMARTYSNAHSMSYDDHGIALGHSEYAIVTGANSMAATTGRDAKAVAAGTRSIAASADSRYCSVMASGEGVIAATTVGAFAYSSGVGSIAAATSDADVVASGQRSVAVATERGAAAGTRDGIAVSMSMAWGNVGSWLVLAETDDDDKTINVRVAQVDGEKIKADTAYKIINGEIVEAL